jgi:hypothetical protein
VPLSDVAGRNRTVPADDPLLKAARGTGVLLGDRGATEERRPGSEPESFSRVPEQRARTYLI